MCVCISPKEKGGGCVCVCETGSVHAHIREMRKTLARQSVGKKGKVSLSLSLSQAAARRGAFNPAVCV